MTNNKTWFQLRPMYNYIRKQAEKEKFLNYLEVGGTFSLVAIFLFFAIMPTTTTISSLIGDIKSKESFIKKVDLKVENIIKAQESYSQIQEKTYLIEDAIPSLARYYDSASNLGTISKESSLNIKQISLNLNEGKDPTNNSVKTYQINVNSEGEYSSVIAMIKKLLNNRRVINTTNIRLSQPSKEDNQINSKNIKVNFSNDLYFLSDNNEKE